MYTEGLHYNLQSLKTILFIKFLQDYSKFDLPNETQTVVNVGIDIKDIPKIADKEFSVTLNAFFVVRWKDERLVIDQVRAWKHWNYCCVL